MRDHLYSFLINSADTPTSPPSPPPLVLLEKAIFSIMYLAIHLAHKADMTEQLLKGLQTIATLDIQYVERVTDKIMAALIRYYVLFNSYSLT